MSAFTNNISNSTTPKTTIMNEKTLHNLSSLPGLPFNSLIEIGNSEHDFFADKLPRFREMASPMDASAAMECSSSSSSSSSFASSSCHYDSSYHNLRNIHQSWFGQPLLKNSRRWKMVRCVEDTGREQVMLMNKIGMACLQQQKKQEAIRSFASALMELQKYAPLVCLTGGNRNKAIQLLQNLDPSTPILKNPAAQPNRSLYIYQREIYDEGMYMYRAPLAIASSNQSLTLMETTLLYNLGHAHIQTQNYDDAKVLFNLALQVFDTASDATNCSNEDISRFVILHNLGNCCYRLGENDTALEQYQLALQMSVQAAASMGSRQLLDLAASYNCVAVLHFHQSHPSEPSNTALAYLQMSLASYNSVLSKGKYNNGTDANESCCTKEVATVLSNIGRVYFLRAEYEKALELFQRSLAIRQRVLERDSVDIATAMFNIGQTHHRCGRLEAAMTYYRGFLETAQIQLGTEHRDFAAGLVLLSDVHRERKEFSTAQLLLKQAVQSGRAALGHSHPDLALIFNNLGSLSYELRQYDEALRYYVECVTIQSEFLEPHHPNIVISLLNVAQIHKQKGDYRTAFKVYREVYNVHLDSFGPESMEVATTLSSMALMKYLLRDYRVSLSFYEEALLVHRASASKESPVCSARDVDIAATLNSIGLVRFKMDDFDQAKEAFMECLNIRKRILGADHRDIAVMWYNLATIYLEEGDDQTAMKLYNESLRVERCALGDNNPEISLTMQHLGQMHQERGELDKAVEYFQKALEIERMVLSQYGADAQKEKGSTMALICKLLNLIGNIHLMCGRVDDMMTCFVEACKCGQHNGEGLIIAGHNFYGLSRLHPPCAPLA